MNFNELRDNWNTLGNINPLESILSRDDRKNKGWEIEEFFATGEAEIDAAMENINTLGIAISRNKALDFGCGVGRLTQALARHFHEVYGVDIAPSMIDLANQYNRHGNKCRYILNEAEDLKLFPDNNFDLICSVITLQHMQPRYSKTYLREFLRILAPGGMLIFQIPSEPVFINDNGSINLQGIILGIVPKSVLDATYRRVRYGHQPRAEVYMIKKREMVDFLNRNGARIVSIRQNRGLILVDCRYLVTKD